ncbi:hypothetical protein MTO96_041312 [Rhipicephalus appendiculatus]
MKAKSEIKDVIESLSITIGAIKATLDGLVEGALPRRHSAGELVWCKNYGAGASWRPAVVLTTRGARLSTVKTEDGELCEREQDKLRHRSDGEDAEGKEVPAPTTVNSELLESSPGSSRIRAQIAEPETGPVNTGVPARSFLDLPP